MNLTISLRDVLRTEELSRRRCRPVDAFAIRRANTTIARCRAHGYAALLQSVCELALDTCGAQSAGISILNGSTDESLFVWDALAGQLSQQVGAKVSRRHSPCGVCMDLDDPQLFVYPERHFSWMRQAKIPIPECLVVPLYLEGMLPFGTIWIMMHDIGRLFDQEDVRILKAFGAQACAECRSQISYEG
jgi:GAF domain-containing protein